MTESQNIQNVKLIWVTPNAENLIAYTARVSNPENQENPDYTKLLSYCIKKKHHSIFEMASMCVEINDSRAISRQILRHKSFSFQEFCISGDSLITTIIPSTGAPNKIPIKKLYERQNWKNYKNILLRTFDINKNKFIEAPLKEVFYTGKKQCYKIILEDDKEIITTKEHKFFNFNKEFDTLENILGIEHRGNIEKVVMTKDNLIGVNGVVCYQSKEWMKEAKERSIQNKTGVEGIANEAGVSYHTIRKWLKTLGLSFTKKEVALFPELALDINNVIPVHQKCHMEYHGKTGFFKNFSRGQGNKLVPKFYKVKTIEYVGEIDTYDLEIDHESHNYIANGFMVHNSQRYQDVSKLSDDKLINECRMQDHKNRQSSLDSEDQYLKEWWVYTQEQVWKLAMEKYQEALANGIAKEVARVLLPEGMTPSRLYMTGSVRSWIHYLCLRTGNGTQKEHQLIANQIKEIFKEQFPIISSTLDSLNWQV